VADKSGRDETSYQERLAFAVAGTVLGTGVEPYDQRGRQRAVDALLHYPGGRRAALEVTAVGPEAQAPIQHFLGERGHSRTIPGVTGTWLVQLPRTFHPSDMPKVGEGLRRCEERGAGRLAELAAAGADREQLARRGVRAERVRAAGARVHFALSPTAGPSFPARRGLPAELDAILATPRIESKTAKLAASGLAERHLFLLVLPGAFTHPVFDALAFGGPPPDSLPRLPGGLSQVWLLTGVRAGGVVRAVRGVGWRRDDPYDAIDIAALR
jgi:hypothetical protein